MHLTLRGANKFAESLGLIALNHSRDTAMSTNLLKMKAILILSMHFGIVHGKRSTRAHIAALLHLRPHGREHLTMCGMDRPPVGNTAQSQAIRCNRRSSDSRSWVAALTAMLPAYHLTVSAPNRNSSATPWHMATSLSMAEQCCHLVATRMASELTPATLATQPARSMPRVSRINQLVRPLLQHETLVRHCPRGWICVSLTTRIDNHPQTTTDNIVTMLLVGHTHKRHRNPGWIPEFVYTAEKTITAVALVDMANRSHVLIAILMVIKPNFVFINRGMARKVRHPWNIFRWHMPFSTKMSSHPMFQLNCLMRALKIWSLRICLKIPYTMVF